MKKSEKNHSTLKLMMIAMMSAAVIFTMSACNNDSNVNNNGNNNAMSEGVNDAPDAPAEDGANTP